MSSRSTFCEAVAAADMNLQVSILNEFEIQGTGLNSLPEFTDIKTQGTGET
jgi:hypothetical protein